VPVQKPKVIPEKCLVEWNAIYNWLQEFWQVYVCCAESAKSRQHDTAPAPECWNKVGHGQFREGGHGERVEREPITGVWGHSGVPGQSPWSGG